jgi:two-component system, NarL family, response regulator LiaR
VAGIDTVTCSAGADPIRVLVVDDHAMVRRGLATFLLAFDDLQMVGEAAAGNEVVSRCAETHPDVILMDLKMPGVDGVEATRAVRAAFPSVRIIALTNFREEGLVQSALQAGAISYLLKNVSAEELAAAIRAAHAGRSTLAPEATDDLVQSTANVAAPGHDLTPREREVLALMVQGFSNAAIADRLFVSRSTAKAHVSSILAKLDVTSRTEAVALTVQHHLLD